MGLSNWEMFVHFFLSTGEQSTILNMTTTPKSWLSSQGWFLSTLCWSFSSKKTHPDAKAGKESGAIMLYLAEKYQRFIPNDARPYFCLQCVKFSTLPLNYGNFFVWGKYAN